MTITQALALRPGQRVTLLHPDREVRHGRVTSQGRKVFVEWNEHGETAYDHRYMHYVHVLVETTATRETV